MGANGRCPMGRSILTRVALLGAGAALASVFAATPAQANVAPIRPPAPAPSFGCTFQGSHIDEGETVVLTDDDGFAVGFASCTNSRVYAWYF